MKKETIERIRNFTIDRDWDQFHSPANLAKSISIEANELLECFQWSDDNYDINEVKEIRTRTTVYFGVGAIQKIHDIAKDIKSKGIDKVIVMSGRNAYKATGAWDVVESALKNNFQNLYNVFLVYLG